MSESDSIKSVLPAAVEVTLQQAPFSVPMPDGKIIQEHFGEASIKVSDISVARMVAPPFWTESFQIADFDEVTYVIRGVFTVETASGVTKVMPMQSVFVPKGTKVRYSNPAAEECEYLAVCTPAFALDRVKRF
jgi:ethanolamine utilization protein EutQ